jgi:hypothetical protein
MAGIELQRKGQKERKGFGKRATDEEETSLDEKIIPGAVAGAGGFTGPRNQIPFAFAEEVSHPSKLQRNWQQERE